MALDSKETMEHMARLALQYGVDAIVLRPDADSAWEWDKKGRLVKRNIDPLKVTRRGKRCFCTPKDEDNMWDCQVYNEHNVELSQFFEQFPN